ncbi:MAG: DUF5074 domain-containing protein [Bacteroidales bacterium]|jgi:hypothetical protein|nr:DUF5074 domain-containing protein [Bacteroidales bacterium]MDD5047156.1 BACON domain-containing carbohydrate-binding protein [Bacteroidales bacterium]MDY0352848.1 BACON domain-containing carbohydrate-binding protein [Bacteroidales bacterium]HHV03380.1 DUF5074 domain-containing protein [Bacteroidales bacterium]
MKNNFLWLWTVVLIVGFTACSSYNDPFLNILSEFAEVTFEEAEKTQTITFETNQSWTASIKATKSNEVSWLSVSPKSGNAGKANVTLTANELNYTEQQRIVYIHIAIDGLYRSITVTQEPVTFEIPEDIHFLLGETEKEVTFQTGQPWEASVEYENPDEEKWLALSSDKGEAGNASLTASVKENPSLTLSRTADILIHVGQLHKSIRVIQAAGLPDFSNGTFILNEGNMTSESGSLIYIDSRGVIYDDIYTRINGTNLGNVCQDLYIHKDKLYIVSQNGGEDGKLVIANANTLKKEQGFNSEISVSWPSHIAVTSYDNVYIRSNTGVHRFNPQTSTLTAISGSNGVAKNRMVAVGNKVFAYAGKKMLVMEDGKDEVIHSIELDGAISGIVPSSDGKIWVAHSTSHFMKIDPDNYSIIGDQTISGVSISGGYSNPSFTAFGDLLYFRNGFVIWRHNFSNGQTTEMVYVKDYVENAGIVYNNLGVHPLTGEVYFNTIKAFGWDYLINNISVFDFSNSSFPLKMNYENYTKFPAGIFFSENFK